MDTDCTCDGTSAKLQQVVKKMKPDFQKLHVLRARFTGKNIPKIQTLINSQSDGGGAVSSPDLTLKEERRPGSPCPSTSNCDQMPHWPTEQNVLQSRVIQEGRGENDEEANMIISSEDDGVYEIPEAPLGLSKSLSSPGVKSPTKALSRTQKPKIPIIPARHLRRRHRDCHVAQAENIKLRDDGTFRNFQNTSHVHTPAVVSAPAVVPSKNIQNAPVIKSIAEELGLRKPKRRASDQSEHALDHVKELRLRGREVEVGSKWKPPILHKAKGINLKLDPQETQFHKQKHDQIHKVTATSPTKRTTPLSTTMYAKKAKHGITECESVENKGDNAVDTTMQSCAQESNESDDNYFTNFPLSSHNWNITVVPVDSLPIPRDQPEETIQPSYLPQPPASEASNTSHQSGDSLKTFPKSTKTTIKTFTPISRSDSLVKDMEKLPPPKPKTSHQAHMSQPPLLQLPSAQRKVRPPPVAKSLSIPPQADEQACKTCLEQPPTDRKEPYAEAFASPWTTFIVRARILKWKHSWFKEYKQFGLPKSLCDQPLKQVPQTFRSFMDYYNTFFPLLLTNTFEELVREWQAEDRVRLKLMVQSINYYHLDSNHTVNNANFTVILTHEEESQQLYPKENDVVILWIPQNRGSHVHSHCSSEHRPDNCQPHFGIVSHSKFTGVKRELKLMIRTCGNVSAIDKQLVQCEVVGSVQHAAREFNALFNINNSALIHTILAPDKHFLPDPKSTVHFLPNPEFIFEECNPDQSKAINCVVSMVMSKQPTPKICLIHAPPGTGKSYTIVNLLYQLSQKLGAAPPTGQKHWRILVCAPTDAVVGSLLEKINVFFQKRKSQDGKHKGNCGNVNVVRLGNDKNIGKKVVEFSLRHQINRRLSEDSRTVPDQCKSRKQNIQRLILQEANIICCTLSFSGSSDLHMAFPTHHHNETPFNCVIIDEAGQAKETETLIPLLFRCPSLVLVGDPEQLPPSVISQKTKELRFDQSLMARLYKCLHHLNPPRIHFLSQQYRMHPDIQNFPSKYFYRNLLKMDRKITHNCCPSDWVCESYRVFDVAYGQEMREKNSYFNCKEVELTVELARLVSKNYRLRNPDKPLDGVVAVITPYSKQRVRILKALQEKRLKNVVVDTIDGFQGREMDCIIVSCVRSSHEMDCMGFLGSRQQMNISITRAKYSLFIVGHLNTLKEYEHWRALIDDAESRGTIITTRELYYKLDAWKILKRDNIHSIPGPSSHSQTLLF